MTAGRDLSALRGSKELADIDFAKAEARVDAYSQELGRKALAKFDESRRLGLSVGAARVDAVMHVARNEGIERKWVEHAFDAMLKDRSNKEVHI